MTYLDWLAELHQGLQDGTRPYSDWCDSYTCSDRTDKAIEECGDQLRLAQEEAAQLTEVGGTQ